MEGVYGLRSSYNSASAIHIAFLPQSASKETPASLWQVLKETIFCCIGGVCAIRAWIENALLRLPFNYS